MPDKVDKVRERLDQAKQAAEIGKEFAPPGVRGRIQDGEDIIDAAGAGIGILQKLKSIFKKKKK